MFEKFKENRQLAKLAKSDNWEDRAEAARKGYKPEKLAHDKDARVRMALAENGYALDTLAADESSSIRAMVAEKTTNPLTLAKLSNDISPHVARVVAQNNYTMLDTLYTLAKHSDAEVRACSVANMDFSIHLDDLAKDSSPLVRLAVAQKLVDNGMSIDRFANDVYNTSVGNKHDLWYYGTPKQKLAIGKNYCIITDVQGAKANIDYYGKENCFVVFVHATDKIRTNRAMQRGSFDIYEWERRLKDDSLKFSSTQTDGLIDLTIENDEKNNIADLAKTVYENIIIKQKMRVFQNRKER